MFQKKNKKQLKASNKFSFKSDSASNKTSITHIQRQNRKSFIFRSWFTLGIVSLLMIGVYFHIAYLQIHDNKKYTVSSKNNYIKLIPITPQRGIITDRNGIGLAVNKQEYSLFIQPLSTKKTKEILDKIASVITLTEDDYNTFQRNRRNNLYRTPTLLKDNISQEEISKLLVNKYFLENVSIMPVYTRYYPFGSALPHILGYVGSINDKDAKNIEELDESIRSNYLGTTTIGKIGLEKYYEQELLGKIGYENVEVNSTGDIIKVIDTKDPVAGNSLRLAIDLPLQLKILDLVKNERAAVVVTKPKTGEVLAIVSNPVFDANLFVKGIASSTYSELLTDPDKPLYNRPTLGIYPPGSTIKPFVSFAGLDSGFVTKNTKIFDPGYWILPGTTQKYRDWLRSGHGTVDVHKAITESVDTYYYDLAYRMGIDRLAYYMKKFGFGSRTGLDIHEESGALYPTPEWKEKRFNKKWVNGDTPPVGIGQGYFSATPIQIVNALNIAINRGVKKTPHLLLESVDSKNTMNSNSLTGGLLVNNNIIDHEENIFPNSDKDHWDTILYGMWGVTNQTNGSGYRAFAGAGYQAGGKSGTAQVFGLKGSDYKAHLLNKRLHDHALFIAFAPYADPEISLSIIVENGGGGAKVAGPIARQIIDYYLKTRLPHSQSSMTCREIQYHALEDLKALGYEIPNHDWIFNLEYLSRGKNSCQIDTNSLPNPDFAIPSSDQPSNPDLPGLPTEQILDPEQQKIRNLEINPKISPAPVKRPKPKSTPKPPEKTPPKPEETPTVPDSTTEETLPEGD